MRLWTGREWIESPGPVAKPAAPKPGAAKPAAPKLAPKPADFKSVEEFRAAEEALDAQWAELDKAQRELGEARGRFENARRAAETPKPGL